MYCLKIFQELDRALALCGRRCHMDVSKWSALLAGVTSAAFGISADEVAAAAPLRTAHLSADSCVERFRRVYERVAAAAAARRKQNM